MHQWLSRVLRWCGFTGAGLVVYQAGGCSLDPDILLRAGLTAGSDLAIFLLENLTSSF